MPFELYKIFAGFVAAALVALFCTPVAIRISGLVGAMDKPDHRKVHAHPTPRLGGVAIFLAVAATVLLGSLYESEIRLGDAPFGSGLPLLSVALLMVVILGIWDDIRPVKALPKLGVQVLAATLVYSSGFEIPVVEFFSAESAQALWPINWGFTVLWIAGITNATNLIDGLDGLAAGITGIASITIAAIALSAGDVGLAFAAAAIAGALLGFLRFNFNPARVFLGDSGSLFLGFSLSILAVLSIGKTRSAFHLLIPILVLGLPIVDTGLSMARRLLRDLMTTGHAEPATIGGLRKMFVPDRNHIHHRLLNLGFSHRGVVLLLYFFSALLGVAAFVISWAGTGTSTVILVGVTLTAFPLIHRLQYSEILVHRNGVLLRLFSWFYSWPPLRRRVFQISVDACFILCSFLVAHFIADPRGYGTMDFTGLLLLGVLSLAVQLLVFGTTGLYNRTTRRLGVGDAIWIARSVVLAALVFFILSWVLRPFVPEAGMVVAILQGYFLLTLVLGSRFAYTLLSHYLTREEKGKIPVLIYGANTAGVLLHQLTREHAGLNMFPVGFIDDDISMEGKSLNGSPVFGTHWNLKRILADVHVDMILIAAEHVPSENLVRLRQVCSSNGITISRLCFTPDSIQFARINEAELAQQTPPDTQQKS